MAVVVTRFGEIRSLAIALALVGFSIMAVAASSEPLVLAALQFAIVFCATGMRLAALSFVTLNVRLRTRGKALANIGGLRRVGAFIGPLIGGLLIDRFDYALTFVIAGALSLVGILPALGHERSGSRTKGVVVRREPVLGTIRAHWRRLLSTAAGPLMITAARKGRGIVLPLIAASLGVSATATGIIVAISTGADMLLFPVAGYIMDRFGRLFAIFPAFLTMAAGLVVLGVVDSAFGVVVAGSVIGVGNGLSAGSLMTLGSDLAPKESPSLFLAAFSTLQDTGQVIGPILVGIIADSLGLQASAIALAVALTVGLMLIVATIGETATADTLPATRG